MHLPPVTYQGLNCAVLTPTYRKSPVAALDLHQAFLSLFQDQILNGHDFAGNAAGAGVEPGSGEGRRILDSIWHQADSSAFIGFTGVALAKPCRPEYFTNWLVKMSATMPTRTQAERADQTRTRILDAAVHAFSENGLAGARTEQIAEAAGVNKALLYYYFESKGALYEAALEAVAQKVVANAMAAMSCDRSAGELVVQFALNHFDRIHSQQPLQSLMQQEMMRVHRGEKHALTPIVEKVFQPMMVRLRDLLLEGKSTGELIPADDWQIMYAALGANVFYFLSAPVVHIMTKTNPLERGAMKLRRNAAIEYLGMTIFTDRKHGLEIAARVLASTPMPQSGEFKNFERKAK